MDRDDRYRLIGAGAIDRLLERLDNEQAATAELLDELSVIRGHVSRAEYGRYDEDAWLDDPLAGAVASIVDECLRLRPVAEAAEAFEAKVAEIIDSDEYQAVVSSAFAHGVKYTGENWGDERGKLRDTLDAWRDGVEWPEEVEG